jgi:hypothetical protein
MSITYLTHTLDMDVFSSHSPITKFKKHDHTYIFLRTYALNGVSKQIPRSLGRATLRGGADDQVPTEQPCKAERATKSMSSNLARRSGWSSPCRATSRGRLDDQVLAEQPNEAERTSPCQAISSETGIRKCRPNDTSPRQQEKTGRHQTMFGPRVRCQKI